MGRDENINIDLLKDCLSVLNQVTNQKYWSYQECKESRTYTLTSKVEDEIKRLETTYDTK